MRVCKCENVFVYMFSNVDDSSLLTDTTIAIGFFQLHRLVSVIKLLYIHNDLSTVCWLRAHHLHGYMKCLRSLSHSLVLVQMRRLHIYTHIYMNSWHTMNGPTTHNDTHKHIHREQRWLGSLSLSCVRFKLHLVSVVSQSVFVRQTHQTLVWT